MNRLALIAANGFHWDSAMARDGARDALSGHGIRPRRMNRFIEIALAGAMECCHGSRLPEITGIYLATRHGDARDTLAQVTEIQAQRMLPMPVAFIGLSGNMAGYHIATATGARGPSVSVSSERDLFGEALELAALDLLAGVTERALVGHVEDSGKDAFSWWLLVSRGDSRAPAVLEQSAAAGEPQLDAAERMVNAFRQLGDEEVQTTVSSWRVRASGQTLPSS